MGKYVVLVIALLMTGCNSREAHYKAQLERALKMVEESQEQTRHALELNQRLEKLLDESQDQTREAISICNKDTDIVVTLTKNLKHCNRIAAACIKSEKP